MTKEEMQNIMDAELQEKFARKDKSFGCKVSLKGIPGWKTETIVKRDAMDDTWLGVHIEFGDNEIKKVLGHPLTLTDILRALSKTSFHPAEGKIVFNSTTKCICFYQYGARKPFRWDMEHNLYKDQSEDVRKFVCDILLEKS